MLRVAMVAYTYYASDPRVRREAEALAARGDHVDFFCLRSRGEPAEERPFVEEAVARAGYALPTADLSCTEYWRPPNEPESYWPSVLDHGVVAGGRFGEAEVRGMCERLRCQPTEADAMDPDFAAVSDHCPVVLRGTL